MTTNATAPTQDRRLLAAVSRWRKDNGWGRDCRGVYTSPDRSFGVDICDGRDDMAAGFRIMRGELLIKATEHPAANVGEAIDILVALDVLPAQFSSAYETGWRDGHFADGYPERTPTGLEHALAEILTAVNHTDSIGAYDDYDDCSADELHTHRELTRIRNLITEIRVRNNLPVVTE